MHLNESLHPEFLRNHCDTNDEYFKNFLVAKNWIQFIAKTYYYRPTLTRVS